MFIMKININFFRVDNKNGIDISNFIPIGVVVVPSSHNIYRDNSCAIISLKNMSVTTPDIGTTLNSNIYWGHYGENISLKDYSYVGYVFKDDGEGDISESVIGIASEGILPSDLSYFNYKDNPYDIETNYTRNHSGGDYYIPSPYNNNGNFNIEYSKTTSPSNNTNAMSDFNGRSNSKILYNLATAQSNWRTASNIVDNNGEGYSPAACCCWRYHTDGTKQGDWYLPACGELGYMIVRFDKIRKAFNNILAVYKDDYIAPTEMNDYFSSTRYNDYLARTAIVYTGAIEREGQFKRAVRAFLRIGPNGNIINT